MRAILLASATATTLKGRRAMSWVSQGYFPGFSMARRKTECAPTKMARMAWAILAKGEAYRAPVRSSSGATAASA